MILSPYLSAQIKCQFALLQAESPVLEWVMGYLLFINKSHQRVAFIVNSYVCHILAQFHSVPLIVLSNLHGSGVSHLSLKKLARICLFSSAMPPWAMHWSTPFIHMCISYYSKVSQQRESFFWACGDGLSSPKSVSSFFAFWYARDRPAAVCVVYTKKNLTVPFWALYGGRCSPHIWLTLE